MLKALTNHVMIIIRVILIKLTFQRNFETFAFYIIDSISFVEIWKKTEAETIDPGATEKLDDVPY